MAVLFKSFIFSTPELVLMSGFSFWAGYYLDERVAPWAKKVVREKVHKFKSSGSKKDNKS